jgi:transcriptional regulator with XRE-family HTH domain
VLNNPINDNILSFNNILQDFNPTSVAKTLALRAKQRRLELNLTQEALAKRSGVSLGSLRRFENIAEISLKSLIKIAIALNSVEEFKNLFSKINYTSIEDIIDMQKAKERKRGRRNV